MTHEWRTTAVTALPLGWIHVCKSSHDGSRYIAACPGILLQEEWELAQTEYGGDERAGSTRAVFAFIADGDLVSAYNVPEVEYTITEAEYAAEQRAETNHEEHPH